MVAPKIDRLRLMFPSTAESRLTELSSDISDRLLEAAIIVEAVGLSEEQAKQLWLDCFVDILSEMLQLWIVEQAKQAATQ